MCFQEGLSPVSPVITWPSCRVKVEANAPNGINWKSIFLEAEGALSHFLFFFHLFFNFFSLKSSSHNPSGW
jgi:hypothetical protein